MMKMLGRLVLTTAVAAIAAGVLLGAAGGGRWQIYWRSNSERRAELTLSDSGRAKTEKNVLSHVHQFQYY